MGEDAASERLKEIDNEHLGYLALDEFPAPDISALRGLIRNRLVNRAEREWLDFDGRESALGALRDLVGMIPTPND